MDEEASKKSEETRRISNEGEKGDYVSDRGCRRFKSYLGSQKSSFVRTGIFTYYLFTIHSSLNTNEDFEVISKSE